MNAALPKRYFDEQGLVSLHSRHRMLAGCFVNRRIRNRTYGGVGGPVGVTPPPTRL